MDFRQLEMFKAVVETGSFTKAGEKLYVSQSAISRQISLLEHELGDRLFRRSHRRLLLTPTGEVLLHHAQKIFHELRRLKTELADLAEMRRGRLHLAGGMSVCTYLFPELLKTYKELYPNIDVRIATGITEEILRMLREDQVDLALLSLPFDDPDLEVIPVLQEELVLVTNRSHPLAHRERVTFADLAPYTFIHFERGSNTRRLLDRIFEKAGVEFENTMELQNVEITKPLVAKGLGISIVPYPAVRRDPTGELAWRRIDDRRIFRELGWVYLKSDYLPKAVTMLLALFERLRPRFAAQGVAPEEPSAVE
ncbi:MAG: LysR family transcriptional regulator [Acidobacteriota bacterium]